MLKKTPTDKQSSDLESVNNSFKIQQHISPLNSIKVSDEFCCTFPAPVRASCVSPRALRDQSFSHRHFSCTNFPKRVSKPKGNFFSYLVLNPFFFPSARGINCRSAAQETVAQLPLFHNRLCKRSEQIAHGSTYERKQHGRL